MSSMNGLSSNNARNQTNNNQMTLDSQTRQNVAAQNEARVLQSIGVIKNDEFKSSGGLNPLKSLYSAAAATFLKNKRGSQTAEKQTNQSQEDSVAAMKALSSSSGSSSVSWQQRNANVSGPASSGGFSKYAWQGKAGPTGSDNPASSTPADNTPAADPDDDAALKAAQQAAADAAAAAAAGGGSSTPASYKDSSELATAFQNQIKSMGGTIGKTSGSTTSIKVLGMTGTVEQRSDELRISLTYLTGKVDFRLDMSGDMNHYSSSGITLLMQGNINKLKDGMAKLDLNHVDVVA